MPGYLHNLPLFPTTVIGSLPRPSWLQDLLKEYLAGRLTRVAWDGACDQAIPFAVALQEAAGIDVITDGEWRRGGVSPRMGKGGGRAIFRSSRGGWRSSARI